MRPRIPGPCMTIGICSPSHVAEHDEYDRTIANIKAQGFRVKEADHLYDRSAVKTFRDDYLPSPMLRAADFNQLIADPEVDMVLFGGGEGACDLLPFIDFDAVKKHPKCICSYSDGTYILDAVYAKTGLETYYGYAPFVFDYWAHHDYDKQQFQRHFVTGTARSHVAAVPWKVQTKGACEGILIGGYAGIMALMQGSSFFSVDLHEDYVLFLEDLHFFGDVEHHIAGVLADLEQSDLMLRVRGLLFGSYDEHDVPELYAMLKSLGERWNIPVAYCDDFGHGLYHAVMPIGRRVAFDTNQCTLKYLDEE